MTTLAEPHPLERAARQLWLRRGFRSEWRPSAAGRLHVLSAPGSGSLPGVVAVHGIGSGALPFLPVLQRLRPHVRSVAALESPGHGFSGEPEGPLTAASWQGAVHAVLDELTGDRPLLLGNSLGGALAFRYALRRPERLAALTLCSPAGAPLSEASLQRLRSRFSVPDTATARDLVRDLFARPPWYAGLIAPEITRRLRRPWVQGFLASIGPDDFLQPDEVATLSVPTLLLWGTGERLLPDEVVAWYRAHLPAAARIERPDTGHIPQVERPAWLADRLLAFLRERA
jgi:pimeloyl-ACP methyl ester carboxylesterase